MGIDFKATFVETQDYPLQEGETHNTSNDHLPLESECSNGGYLKKGRIHFWDNIGEIYLGRSHTLRSLIPSDADSSCGHRDLTADEFVAWMDYLHEKEDFPYFTWDAAYRLAAALGGFVRVYWC